MLSAVKQVPQKSDIQSPILGDVHFTLSGDGVLTVHATDTKLTVETRIPVGDSFGEGAICIPSTDLDLITGLRGDVVEFDYESKTQLLKVKSGKEKATIKGHDPDDYILIDMSVSGQGHIVPFDALKAIIERTYHSAGRADVKSEALKAISIDCSEGEMTALSTDTRRVSAVFNESVGHQAGTFNLLVEAEQLRVMTQLIDGLTNVKDMSVYIVGGKVYFKSGDVTVSIALTTGNFPDLSVLFTDDALTHAIVDLGELSYVLDFVGKANSDFVEFDVIPMSSEVLVSCWEDDNSDKGAKSSIVSENEGSHMGKQNHCILVLEHVKEQVKKYIGMKHEKVALLFSSRGFMIMQPLDSEIDYAVFTPRDGKTRYSSTMVL